jgi:hypothetical protein
MVSERLPPLLKKAASGWPPGYVRISSTLGRHISATAIAPFMSQLVPGEMHLDALASNRKHQGFAFAHQ